MNSYYRHARTILTVTLLLLTMTSMAQEVESSTPKPEWGAEFTTEQQLTNRGRYNCANLLHLEASLPLGKGFTVEGSAISAYMTSKESIGNELQTFSNLDAGTVVFALAKLGVGWVIPTSNAEKDSHELFLGIRNMNEDYFASPVTTFFTNSSGGIYPTVGSNYPIANYPVASVGAHYRYSRIMNAGEEGVEQSLAVQASLYNGTGYNRFTGRENVFRVCPDSDGAFGLAQIEYQHGGGSYYLGGCAHYSGVDDKQWGSTLWAYAEQQVSTNISLLAGYSHAFADADCQDFAAIGGIYSWKCCELGLFTDYALFGGKGESATELTCKVTITPYLHIQPSAHLIFTGNRTTAAATLRIGVSI